MMNPEKDTPEISDNGRYAQLIVQIGHCNICKKPMVKVSRKELRNLYHLFPYFVGANFQEQTSRAGIILQGKVRDKYDRICEECEKAGRVTFCCELCGKNHQSDMIQESFGDPPDHLCKTCYETVPAKIWDKKESELYDSHRYDFE